jgi:hypothetical protein
MITVGETAEDGKSKGFMKVFSKEESFDIELRCPQERRALP